MHLIRAEIARYRSRRLVWIGLLAIVVAVAAYQLVFASEVQPPSAAQRAEAEQYVRQDQLDWDQNHEQYEKDCVDSGMSAADCAYPRPTVDNYLYVVEFDEAASVSLLLGVAVSGLGLFLISASFIGAEMSTGAIGNWLSFVPQRGKVFTAKLVVTALAAAATGALAIALTLSADVVIARTFGVATTGLPTLIDQGLRSLIVIAGLAILGYCIGLLTRHTAAAIGVILGYVVVWYARAIASSSPTVAGLTPWFPETNISAIINHGTKYQVPVVKLNEIEYVERSLSFNQGLTYWLVLLAVAIAVSVVVFRRRDVA